MSEKPLFHYAIGIMSGTSMDGADAVLARFCNHCFDGVLADAYIPFDDDLRQQLLNLQDVSDNELHQSRLLAQTLSRHYIAVVEDLLRQPESQNIPIEAIGCHGQTVRHEPQQGYSIQLADWAMMAEALSIPVVGDFRAADIAAGGQGAPLVPAFHHMCFRQPEKNIVVANIGGIANITVLPAHSEKILGFDTGTGNMLIDAWTQKHFHQAFDSNGDLARQGKILPDLLSRCLADDYFALPPPKSTGRDYFSLSWLEQYLQGDENPYDVLCTLTVLTATTLADAVSQYAPQTLILCGGGSLNAFLREQIAFRLPEMEMTDTQQYGLPVMQVEAAAFAWLAHARIHGICGNIPDVTGAKGYRVLGAIWG